jgi:glycine/D-amino acid oxidase-like deaminating enzyme
VRVIVVGGGVIGCSAACALARRGAKVILVERSVVGSGASGAAAGMLAPLSESDAPGDFVDVPVPQLDSLLVAAGHHRNGILLAGWTGERLAAAILDGVPIPEVVAPGRFQTAMASVSRSGQ